MQLNFFFVIGRAFEFRCGVLAEATQDPGSEDERMGDAPEKFRLPTCLLKP
jgi:hypothetical protein